MLWFLTASRDVDWDVDCKTPEKCEPVTPDGAKGVDVQKIIVSDDLSIWMCPCSVVPSALPSALPNALPSALPSALPHACV